MTGESSEQSVAPVLPRGITADALLTTVAPEPTDVKSVTESVNGFRNRL